MTNLIKVVLLASPILALVFYYTVIRQSEIKMDIKKAETEFNQRWDDFNADFEKDPVKKKEYQLRADKSAKKLEELKEEEKKKKSRADKFEDEFEKELENFNKQKGKDFEKELQDFNKESGGEKK